MGLRDKIKHATEGAKGKAKEGSGKVLGDKSLESEGKVDQTKADFKKAGENVKDAFEE